LSTCSRTAAAALLSTVVSGCFGSPSPLAPGLRGSVGLPNQGVLTGGEVLPVSGLGFERYRHSSSHYYGVPRLVSAIQKAAADVAVAAPGGAPLLVGDLSAAYGGKIPNHASHRSGRDVDLLYFVSNLCGQPVASPGFVGIGNDGLLQVPTSGRFLQFDVNRQWLLVRSLLTNREVEPLWMFVSRDIEARLIEQARALGEPNELVWRAEQVLHQPRDSAPHDDHLHLRVACSRAELLEGCEGGGPHWPWFEDEPFSAEFDGNLRAAINAEPGLLEATWANDNDKNTELR